MSKKKLIIINGTMGVGKTETCKQLYMALENSVWLDGDWCWMMNPFIVNEENKKMVENNINYILRSFLTNSSFEYIIFNWVIHQEYIFDLIIDRLKDLDFDLFKITLICSEEELRRRLIGRMESEGDAENVEETIKMCTERLPLYMNMDTIKIDTTNITIKETVNRIVDIVRG